MKDDWSLCVGIGTYCKDAALDTLGGAINDALRMHEWLLADGAVPPEHATIILSPDEQRESGAVPAAREIEDYFVNLYRVAQASRRKGDGFVVGRRLWLHFAGHGMTFEGAARGEGTGLLTADAQLPGILPHFAMGAWAELFRASGAFREVVLFGDCCRILARRTPLRTPYLQREDAADGGGRCMMAYAASESRSTYETVVANTKRGRFSLALEGLLRKARMEPITARGFLSELELVHADLDPYPPRSAAQDFVLIEGTGGPRPPNLLVAHGESTAALAQPLADMLADQARIPDVSWEGDVHHRTKDNLKSIDYLVVTRSLEPDKLKELVELVDPLQTVVYAARAPMPIAGRHLVYVPRADDEPDISSLAREIDRALELPRTSRTIVAPDALTYVRVWNRAGELVGEGFGEVELIDVVSGDYRVRTSVGRHVSADQVVRVFAGGPELDRILVEAPNVPLPKRQDLVLWFHGTRFDRPSRIAEVRLTDGVRLAVSLPIARGWRTEVFLRNEDVRTPLSVRMVPTTHPIGAPHRHDGRREQLALTLAGAKDVQPVVHSSLVPDDPLSALLSAALGYRNGSSFERDLELAAAQLGPTNPDVQLMRGAYQISEPPLLAQLWHTRLQTRSLSVPPRSNADRTFGRLWEAAPWFSWTPGPLRAEDWLSSLADAVWPGWDRAPNATLASESIRRGCTALGATEGTVFRRLQQRAVARLMHHDTAFIVGGTNATLAAAIAVAFVARNRRPWRRLEAWSLDSATLRQVATTAISTDALVRLGDETESRLRALVGVTSKHHRVDRYSSFELEGHPMFVSLWDPFDGSGVGEIAPWTSASVSRSVRGRLVPEAREPERFRRLVEAYRRLQGRDREPPRGGPLSLT